jgi:tetratricopeptide (TPR) repeat protein
MSHNPLGVLLADLGRRPEAEAQYRRALALQEKLAAQFPAVPQYRDDLAGSHDNLGLLLAGLGKRPEAEEQYRRALALKEKLAAEFPAVPRYQVALGGAYCNFGNLIRNGGQPGKSPEWFTKAIRILTAVYDQDRQLMVAKRFLRNSHENRAYAYDALHQYAEAVQDWDRAVELSHPQEQPFRRAKRATSRVQAGQVAEAVAEVAELSKMATWNTGQWYDFARVYALASGKVADKKQEYADCAMQLLHQAVKAGWKDAAHMTKDTDIDSLRGREDFRKLIGELEKKPVAGKEKQIIPDHCLYEGEDLKVLAAAGCRDVVVQDMEPFGRADWSNGKQLFCHASQKGFVELQVDVPETSRYTLEVRLTRAPDFGRIEVALDGRKKGAVFDGYDERVGPAAPIRLGTVELRKGSHRLRFTAVDKNPRSSDFFMGIDWVKLSPGEGSSVNEGKKAQSSPSP